MTKYVDSIRMVTEECCECGTNFAMTQDLQSKFLRSRKSFFCPNGHSQHYIEKTVEQKLKDQLVKKTRRINSLNSNVNNLKKQKNKVVKQYNHVRNRIKNGVCPCCNRTFTNLLNHMETQHPEFGRHDILKSIRNVYGLSQKALGFEIGINPLYISKYENNKPLSVDNKKLIDSWIKQSA